MSHASDRETKPSISTLGKLKESGYKPCSVKEEIRNNLILKLSRAEPLFTDVVGYENTVVPQITNAILGCQDIIFLGERGQAKSRIVRGLTSLLDEWSPVLANSEIPEDPLLPITMAGKTAVAEQGDEAPIDWLHRDERYGEKLATPDITIADIIGEVDPIKVAEGRYLSDELTLHYGLVPRMNKGIFAINELPDLSERIQVGLLNLLEERDIQIRGHKVRLPLDVFILATANPEDYTNRGRIITPLKDRYGAQIRTHYPELVEQEIEIIEQEANVLELSDYQLTVPEFMKEIIAEVTHHARKSPDLNQRSGVSVRASISNYEAMVANAFRRALVLNEAEVVPRISDLDYITGSFQGKVEFESMEEGQEDKITQRIIHAATKAVFDRRHELNDLAPISEAFNEGLTIEIGEAVYAEDYTTIIEKIPGMSDRLTTQTRASRASEVEFILEGLHLNKLLNKYAVSGRATYSG
ncbi:MAG: magnesium chelatase [Pseudomonadales bacterium]|nr:magnesium chelatase [Pseudomonadales bacterium]